MRSSLLVLLLVIVACSSKSKPAPSMDAGSNLDAFVQTGCQQLSDCTPNLCQTAVCAPETHMCQYTEHDCTNADMAPPACMVGACDPTSGSCVLNAVADATPCAITDGQIGFCKTGACVPTPACATPNAFLTTLHCDYNYYSLHYDQNVLGAFSAAQQVLDSYPCAPTEKAPEIGVIFQEDPNAGDEDVTVSLRLVNADRTETTDQTSVDLDLIVLEDTCTATASCANPAAGSGFQGITAGTSNEHVTFHAVAGKQYYFVVDGKTATDMHEFAIEIESCGICQVTDGTRISCDTSTPVSGSTANGVSLSGFTCGTAKTPVTSAGKALPFFFEAVGNAPHDATTKVVGASGPFQLFVIPDDQDGLCDPADCVSEVDGSGGAASLTWHIDPGLYSFLRYWLVVDAATPTTFGIELSCVPACSSLDNLRCGGSGEETPLIADDSTASGAKLQSAWGPGVGCDGLSGLVGPENIYHFIPTITAAQPYRLTLTSHTDGVHLSMNVLDAGVSTNPDCNPTLPCVTSTVEPASTTVSGTRTTTDTLASAIDFTAQPGHIYFIAVDGVDASGGTFDLLAHGLTTAAGCQ